MRHVFALSALILAAQVSVSTAAVVYSTGFEAPTFTAGPLAPSPLAAGQDGWFYDDTTTGGTNIVTGTVAAGTTYQGTQALQVLANPGTNYVVRSAPLSPSAAQPIITMNFAMKIESSSVASPSWGAVVYDNGGANTAELAAFRVTNTGVLNANDGLIGQATTPANFIARDVWRTYSLVMNFQQGTYQILVDGTPVNFGATGTDLDLFFSTTYAGGISEFDLVNRPGAAGANDSARFDAFSITQSAIPEPASLALIAPLLGMLSRRR